MRVLHAADCEMVIAARRRVVNRTVIASDDWLDEDLNFQICYNERTSLKRRWIVRGMAEYGGPTTQSGIYYQNTVAARYLADLLDLSQLPPRERVIEVRVEAPSNVDDIVVRFADGHREWLQAKLRVQPFGKPWNTLWSNLAAQLASPEFGADDRLVLVLGELDSTARTLRDLCDRSGTASDKAE